MSLHYLYTMLLHYTLWSPVTKQQNFPPHKQSTFPPVGATIGRPLQSDNISTAQPITPYNGRGDLWSPVTKQWDFSLTIRQPPLSPFAKKFLGRFFQKATPHP